MRSLTLFAESAAKKILEPEINNILKSLSTNKIIWERTKDLATPYVTKIAGHPVKLKVGADFPEEPAYSVIVGQANKVIHEIDNWPTNWFRPENNCPFNP